MKKLLITLMVVLSAIIPASAEMRYRGFVDVGGGISFAPKTGTACMLTTTHGIQCTNHLFTGIGAGIGGENYYNNDWGGNHMYLMIPFYCQVRYDFPTSHSRNWYIGLKGGGIYIGTVNGDASYYVAPETGMRFVLSKDIALNLGVRSDVYAGYNGFSVLVVCGIEF